MKTLLVLAAAVGGAYLGILVAGTGPGQKALQFIADKTGSVDLTVAIPTGVGAASAVMVTTALLR